MANDFDTINKSAVIEQIKEIMIDMNKMKNRLAALEEMAYPPKKVSEG
jgi:hypothetical protein